MEEHACVMQDVVDARAVGGETRIVPLIDACAAGFNTSAPVSSS
jgi:hypothetical protein